MKEDRFNEMNVNNGSNAIKDHPNSGFESALRESIGNMFSDTHYGFTELLLGHYPNLNQKEMAVCLALCYVVWDERGNTVYETVIEYSMLERVEGKQLFENEQEAEETVKQMIEKGILNFSIYFLPRGRIVKCDSNTCKRTYLHPVRYLDLKNDIGNEAFMIASKAFRSEIEGALGPVIPEGQ